MNKIQPYENSQKVLTVYTYISSLQIIFHIWSDFFSRRSHEYKSCSQRKLHVACWGLCSTMQPRSGTDRYYVKEGGKKNHGFMVHSKQRNTLAGGFSDRSNGPELIQWGGIWIELK